MYAKTLYSNCSIQTMLKVIINDNVNDEDVSSAFQKYSETHEIKESGTKEGIIKQRKGENAARISMEIHHDNQNSNMKRVNTVFQAMKSDQRVKQAIHKEYLTKEWTFITPSYNNIIRFYQKFDAETMGVQVITVSYNSLYELARRQYTHIIKLSSKKKHSLNIE